MDKVYPVIYDQQNYPDKLGTSPTATIATDGCFVTALAMKAGYYNHPITPPDLNKLFTNFNGNPIYIGGDLLPDNALAQVFSDVSYIKTLDYEPIPTDLQMIKSLLSDAATTVTIRINRGNGNLHFVEAVACDGNTLHIANPWTGRVEDFNLNYGDPVTAKLHIIVYSGVSFVQAAPPTDAQPSPMAIRFNQAITKATNFDAVADFFGITQEQRVTTTAGLIVIEKVKQLQSDLQAASEDLQKLRETPPTTTQQVVVTTQQPVPTPPVVMPVPVSAPTFSNGTPAVASTQGSTVIKTVPAPTQVQKLTGWGRFWKGVSFWLG